MDDREMVISVVAAMLARKQWDRLRVGNPALTPFGELPLVVMDERVELHKPFAEEIVSVVGPLILRNEARHITLLDMGDYLRDIADIYEGRE